MSNEIAKLRALLERMVEPTTLETVDAITTRHERMNYTAAILRDGIVEAEDVKQLYGVGEATVAALAETHSDRGALLAIVADLVRRLGEAERERDEANIRAASRADHAAAVEERIEREEPLRECEGADCGMCSGSECNLCGAGRWKAEPRVCDHDKRDRHADPMFGPDPKPPTTEPRGLTDEEYEAVERLRAGMPICGAERLAIYDAALRLDGLVRRGSTR